ncbi:MAG: DNA-directed RNA polymerase subunit omega [Gammaproteobacteria bacterium]|nr:DNA-directed RNA polymerase subunit omega [Gammaproteobacteria bacterium]|tara:strand:+ start:42742 stop:43215 length:474 start_codon:yes stop_codon:yes gene_type:complete
MARVTIEDCLKRINNAYDIVALASKRAKDLMAGSEPLVDSKDKPTVIALREIAEGKINLDYFEISERQKIEQKLFDTVSEEEIIDELNQGYENSEQLLKETSLQETESLPSEDDDLSTNKNVTSESELNEQIDANTVEEPESESEVDINTQTDSKKD